MSIPKKQSWLDLAIEITNFHVQQLKEDPKWTIAKSAISLNRSIGSVSQFITIGQWCHTHERQLRKMRSCRDALEFIAERKREMRTREI